jgi:polysaccharide chain length determinant protein (PEP-CTERM system associated)
MLERESPSGFETIALQRGPGGPGYESYQSYPGHSAGPEAAGFAASVPDGRQNLSPARLLAVLRRRKACVLIPFLVLTLGAVALAIVLPSRWRSEALLAFETADATDPLAAPDPALDAASQLDRVREVVHRRSLIEGLARETGLAAVGAPLDDAALADLRDRIRIQAEGPSTFSLGFEDRDPRRAALVARRFAESLLDASRSQRGEKVEATVGVLEDQLAALEARIGEQERAIEAYKQRWFDELPQQTDALATRLRGASDGLHYAASSVAELEAKRAGLRREAAELERQGFSSDPGRARRDQVRLELGQLERRYTAEHPEVRRARAELEALERGAAAGLAAPPAAAELSAPRLRQLQVASELEAIERRLASARAERGSLGGELDGLRRRLEAAPRHERALAEMSRDYEAARNEHLVLSEKLHAARLASRFEQGRQGGFRLLEPPRVPTAPVGPQRARIALMGLVAGLGMGLMVAFLVEQSDTSFRDSEDFQNPARLPVLAVISSSPSARLPLQLTSGRRAAPAPIAKLEDPFGPIAEQYRILAARLVGAHGAPRPTSVLITSPGIGEGKTTAAVNLSLALAWMLKQERVLLVDADLRRPSVRRMLQMRRGPGLAELLASPEIDPLALAGRHQGLYVLDAGELSHTARAALGSPAARRVFERLRQRFPYVVVDSPPVLAAAEGLWLQQLVDSILLVVRARRTPRELVRRAIESLDFGRLAGVVLTDVDGSLHSYPYAADDERAAGAAAS